MSEAEDDAVTHLLAVARHDQAIALIVANCAREVFALIEHDPKAHARLALAYAAAKIVHSLELSSGADQESARQAFDMCLRGLRVFLTRYEAAQVNVVHTSGERPS